MAKYGQIGSKYWCGDLYSTCEIILAVNFFTTDEHRYRPSKILNILCVLCASVVKYFIFCFVNNTKIGHDWIGVLREVH